MPTRAQAVASRPLLMSLDAAALALGVSRATVKRLIAAGALRSVTIGSRRLVLVAAIDALIATRLEAEAAGAWGDDHVS